ncbi:ABC transporter ATP-binding protein [Agaribacterium sp. ZY112]|uniref:ABC transporter ATP-binding protein n=1 Tax=Agaribacterium sp. ZY112 TaxID=3233574 RepID=UPI003523E544
MSEVISARNVNKHYGRKVALQSVDFDVGKGEIVGLIGPNGAGKTTLLKSILGLAPCDGDLSVLGKKPETERVQLMEQVSFVADTAILPSWLRVSQGLEFMQAVHPRFDIDKARTFLADSNIKEDMKVRQMSKGMVTLTHLALVLAIDSSLLVLDEPTLGLDIINRKKFYQRLLSDYFDGDKTIVITTNQVEEIEHLINRAMFINDGHLVLDESVEAMSERYCQVQVTKDQIEQAKALSPFYVQNSLAGYHCFYEGKRRQELESLGPVISPSLADLFVAKVSKSEGAE